MKNPLFAVKNVNYACIASCVLYSFEWYVCHGTVILINS